MAASEQASQTVRIIHFSDLLCIWAFVSQIRMEELNRQFGARVQVDYRFIPIFGDVESMMKRNWSERGGAKGYNQHVCSVAQQFTHVSVNPAIWKELRPASSLPAHLVLCALRDMIHRHRLPKQVLEQAAGEFRRAFFVECRDIAQRATLFDLLSQCGVDLSLVEDSLNQGRAHAILASDLEMARDLHIGTSPTLLFNEDRQRLAGNVGYRIIEANIHELLARPADQSAWC